MAWLFDVWTLMFWIPVIAAAGTGWFAAETGVVRPLPVAVWFLTALALQYSSAPLSLSWILGMVAQSALAIYVSIRLKLDG